MARPPGLVECRLSVPGWLLRRVPIALARDVRCAVRRSVSPVAGRAQIPASTAAACCSRPPCCAQAGCGGGAAKARRGRARSRSRRGAAARATCSAASRAGIAAGTAAGTGDERGRIRLGFLATGPGGATCANRGGERACRIGGCTLGSGSGCGARDVCARRCHRRYLEGSRGAGARSVVALWVSFGCVRDQTDWRLQGRLVSCRLSGVSRLGRAEVPQVAIGYFRSVLRA